MSEINLKSDETIVNEHKTNLENSAKEMNTISSVGAGSTNHGINSICCNLYEGILMLFQKYSTASVQDIANIKKIDDELHEADVEMTGDML